MVPARVVLLALSIGWPAGLADEPLHVSAAISLRDVLRQIVAEFERQPAGVRAQLNFAGSNTLARQIQAGAPCDVFISADVANADRLIERGLIRREDVIPLLRNELVVVVPVDGVVEIRQPHDLTDPRLHRLALAGEAVPAGHYARQYLEKHRLLESLRGSIVTVDHVRAALTAVESGAADAALVYRTDARSSAAVRVAFVPPPADQPDILYVAAATKASRSPHVGKFLEFLRSPRAAELFRQSGFVPLTSGEPSTATRPHNGSRQP